jgi:acetamidase/formamidase
MRSWRPGHFRFAFSLNLATTIFNRAARLRTAAVLCFICVAIAATPKEADIVDSIPPSYTGGNIDNWRIGKGATMYYPVAVEGGLLSVGDSHASQGDSECAVQRSNVR